MRKKILLSLFLVVIAALLGRAQSTGGYKIGDKAIDFTLKNVDGNPVSLTGSPAGKGYIVVFTSNACPFAQAYESRIIALHKKYAPLGYPVVAINANDPDASPDDSYPKMQERARQKNFPFSYLLDENQQVTKAFGVSRTPAAFILQKQNTDYVVQYMGAIDDNSQNADDVNEKYVENALSLLIAGKPVSLSTTKVTGCSVKWKTL